MVDMTRVVPSSLGPHGSLRATAWVPERWTPITVILEALPPAPARPVFALDLCRYGKLSVGRSWEGMICSFEIEQMLERDLPEVVRLEETTGLNRWGYDAYRLTAGLAAAF